MKPEAQTQNPWALPAIPPAQPSPFPASEVSKAVRSSNQLLTRAWTWLRNRQKAYTGNKRIHVAATVSLGEKRFVAVIEIDGQQFLVGGAATSVVLLSQLKPNEPFGDVLQKTISAPQQAAVATPQHVAIGTPQQAAISAYEQAAMSEPEPEPQKRDWRSDAAPAPIALVDNVPAPKVKRVRKPAAKPVEKASLNWIANMATKRTAMSVPQLSGIPAIKAVLKQANGR
jgi:flagellar biogenesis protein FliO